MNLPNILTILRFVLIPIYLAVFSSNVQAAFLIVLLAGLTDILDGYIARKSGQVTRLGSMLDPLADKLMMLTVILSLLFADYIGWGAAIAMFIRDAGMIAGSAFFHFRGKLTVPANVWGKVTTVLYYPAILFLMLRLSFADIYLWLVIVFSFITSFIYIFQFKILNQKQRTT